MKKFNFSVLLLSLCLITGMYSANAQRITVTLAGNGTAGFAGDGGWDKLSKVSSPFDICVDAARNIYFTDTGNGRVRMISAVTGKVTTIAGGGTSTLDGVPALSALISPRSMCIDGSGNIYIVSSLTHQIKRIDAATQLITTVAGTGSAGFSGDGGPATAATFFNMFGICIDNAGNLYIADQGNNRVRKITAGTGIVTTIAGTGTLGYTGDGAAATAATLNTPTSINVNAAGDVFVMDQSGAVFVARLRKISASTGMITTVAGTNAGSAIFGTTLLNTWLANVTGMCMDGAGNFYCNEISCSCRKLNMTTDSSYAVGGNFGIEGFSDNVKSDLANMNNPYGICIDGAQNLYIADLINNRIRKLIQLTHTPAYAYGKGAYIYTCPGSTVTFDSLLTITDLDSTEMETWSVLTAPAHGSLSGFPTTLPSVGTGSVVRPYGLTYTAATGYAGSDQFRILVSDGTLTDTMTIYVDAGVASVAGAGGVCVGSHISLSDANAGGAWSVSNGHATISTAGVVTGNTTGNDTVFYSVTNTCGSLTTEKIVNVNTLPDAGYITSPETVCQGATVAVTESVPGGAWSVVNAHGMVSGTGAFTGLTIGGDTLVYTVTNGCGSSSTSQPLIVIHCTSTGVAQLSDTAPDIYPNPASASFTVQWDALQFGEATYMMTDITGRLILHSALGQPGSTTAGIDVSGLKEGMYLLTVVSGTAHYTSKVSISR